MELLIQLAAVLLSLLLAAVKSLRYEPNGLSEFELTRQVHAGSDAAAAEQSRRELLPTYAALQSVKEIIISVAIAILLIVTHGSTIGPLLTVLYFFAAYTVAARGWLSGMVAKFQRAGEKHYQKHVAKLARVFAWLAPKNIGSGAGGLASRDELRQLIVADTQLLAPDDKLRLLGAFDFGSLIVADGMVPAGDIKTVEIKETVGPVLLDRLHKEKHNIYVVVKKDIDHIKGLLYMADLTPLDPEIKDVSDALRPKVHYLPVNAPLQDVLTASLVTGRQLFIAVDDHGATKGLITLADTLKFLLGEPLPKVASVATKPHDNTKE
jgi:CBS domain containing-hemolysin-like protein